VVDVVKAAEMVVKGMVEMIRSVGVEVEKVGPVF